MSLPDKDNPVVYLCAEFGIDTNLPTYAGGLGILAGDTMLQAAEQDYPMIGIGLLYQGKRFLQTFTEDGWQNEYPSPFHAENTNLVRPVEVDGKPLHIPIHFFGNEIKIGVHLQRLSTNTHMYFLTTDVDGNPEQWRDIMQSEYFGEEQQLMQQMVLGIGGVKLIEELKVSPSIYHFQEGRPIFAHWKLTKDGSNAKIVYTNHTLVPDGNLVYPYDLVRKYADSYAQMTGMDADELMTPGITDSGFSITQYGLNVADKVSAVSKLHGEFSQKTWPQYKWIAITNGVYMGRWQNREFKNTMLPNHQLWEAHLEKKRYLARTVKKRSGFVYDPNRLVLGWARRISGYKQVDKLFEDAQRLSAIVRKQGQEIQLLVAGKAHPGDEFGKDNIQKVMSVMTNELAGHALFIPNYDIALAYRLIAGVDVWLNTPEYGKEACGTSGIKAASNGVLNATVADGWAHEVNWDGIGWVLDHNNISESFYDTLENKIAPTFYKRDDDGMNTQWIEMMKKTIEMSKNYSAERMLREYDEKLYS